MHMLNAHNARSPPTIQNKKYTKPQLFKALSIFQVFWRIFYVKKVKKIST